MCENEHLERLIEAFPSWLPEGPPRLLRKSVLLRGMLSGQPALAKLLRRPSSLWHSYCMREIALYERFLLLPPQVRVPRCLGADPSGGILILEHLPGAPLCRNRQAARPIGPRCLGALLRVLEELQECPPQLFDKVASPPSPSVRRQMRARLLEDPDEPRWIPEGLLRCQALDLLSAGDAERAISALNGAFGLSICHGDLLLRNVLDCESGGMAIVDWECAGRYPRDWDRALLWVGLTPDERNLVVAAIPSKSPERRLAFFALVVFALCRELRFATSFSRPSGTGLVRLRSALDSALSRLRGGSDL